jgi:hypothetical protein
MQEVEMMPHEPDDAWADEAFEQIRPGLVVPVGVVGLSHVVEEGGGPHDRIVRLASRDVEDLERVKEGVAFRMVARGLLDAIEGQQQDQ